MISKCPECGSEELKEYDQVAEVLCKNCGLVIEDAMPEKSPYSKSHHTVGTLSIAGTGMLDGRIVKNSWLLSNKEKNFIKARRVIGFVAARLNLPQFIKDNAKHIYIETIDKKLAVGRSIDSISLACIYIACLKNNLPRTVQEIIKGTDIPKKEFFNSLRTIKQECKVSVCNITVMDMLDKYMNQLNLQFEAREEALNLYDKIKDSHLVHGKNPKSVAAAILYIVSRKMDLGITQRELAHKMDLFETTIRKRYMEIQLDN